MMSSPYLSLILPAYNEAQRIRATIEEAEAYFQGRELSAQIIVAADGDDGTREIVGEMARSRSNLLVIGSVERKGKGRGIRQAVGLAQGQIIGFADADNKTPIQELDKVLPLFEGGADIVIGIRPRRSHLIERPQPLYRRLGSQGFALFMHTLVGLRDIVDTQCGFKFFTRRAALDLFSRQRIDGYMFDVEVLHLAQRAGYTVAQVAVRWRDDGDSRLDLVTGNLRNVRDLFRIRFGSNGRGAVESSPAEKPAADRARHASG